MFKKTRFTAFHKGLNRFVDPDYIDVDGNSFDGSDRGYDYYLERDNNYNLLEHVGLTCKNGNQIIDGHLLKFKSQSWLSALGGEDKKEFVYPILWNQEELAWGLKVSDDEWIMNINTATDNHQFEIVGHLLTEKEST